MNTRRTLVSLALALTVAGGLAAGHERNLTGAWSLRRSDDTRVALTFTADGGGFDLARATPDGMALRGRGALSSGGWLSGRFEARPGIASGAGDPDLFARALDGPSSGFGLWEVIDAEGALRLCGFFIASDGTRRFESGSRHGVAEQREIGGFAHHLREAIALNSERRPGYEARTGGESAALSRRLVLLERLTTPWAWWVTCAPGAGTAAA